MSKVKMVCSHCGSDDVCRDAVARWDVDAQDWLLSDVQDGEYCEQCGGEARLVEASLEPPASEWEYEQGTVRVKRFDGKGDIRAYRPEEGWTVMADFTDAHPLTSQPVPAAWWLIETREPNT